MSAAAPAGPADTAADAGAQPSAPLRASLDCGDVAVHLGPASIQVRVRVRVGVRVRVRA